MAIASITLALSLIPTSAFVLVFPIYQITYAQDNETQSTQDIQNTATFNTIVAAISGGLVGAVVGAAATLIGNYLNNKHNLKLKKQDREHYLAIELLKLRTECYSTAFKITEPIASTPENPLGKGEIGRISDQLQIWYDQEKGGLLMSEDSDLIYHGLQTTMWEVADPDRPGVDPIYYFTNPRTKQIMDNAEQFRLSLQRDLGVRKDVHET